MSKHRCFWRENESGDGNLERKMIRVHFKIPRLNIELISYLV